MGHIVNWLNSQQSLVPHRKDSGDAVKLTPGQYRMLCNELNVSDAQFVTTVNGKHPIKVIYSHVKAKGDNVILCPREDLFSETDREVGIELVSHANSVTSVPDNMACCEIISVGEDVDNVKLGDLAFIDFFDVKEGYILASEEMYVAGSRAFKALYDLETQSIKPMDNWVITKHAPKRFRVILTGTDQVEMVDMLTTDGIVSGKTSSGGQATHALYQEVIAVGKRTARSAPGVMTKLERKVLDLIAGPREVAEAQRSGDHERFVQYDGIDQDEADLYNALIKERAFGRPCDIQVGEMVAFCKQTGTKIRIRGDQCYLVHMDNVLTGFDDEAMLNDAIRAGKAGQLFRGV